jgi:hypothetical protein
MVLEGKEARTMAETVECHSSPPKGNQPGHSARLSWERGQDPRLRGKRSFVPSWFIKQNANLSILFV